MKNLSADILFALRSLRRNPGFTATAAGVLAVAIGAAAAVFCVVHAVLLADLPYPHADRLVRIYNQNSPTNIWSLSVVDLQALRDDHQSFEAFGALRYTSFALSGVGDAEQIQGARVSSGFFSALGTTAEVGRLDGDLLHDSAEDVASYMTKQNRYTTLHAEALFRQGVRASYWRLLTSPLARFLKFYLLRLGFLDGGPGFAHIVIGCNNSFHKYLKLIELEKAGRR